MKKTILIMLMTALLISKVLAGASYEICKKSSNDSAFLMDITDIFVAASEKCFSIECTAGAREGIIKTGDNIIKKCKFIKRNCKAYSSREEISRLDDSIMLIKLQTTKFR